MSSGPPAIFMFFFVIVAVVIVGSIIVRMGKGLSEWSDNNHQPVLTVPAKVVSKREDVSISSNRSNGNNHIASSSTDYFAAFEFSSGDRKEFSITAHQYGLLAENDTGDLTFQGTRFQGFVRHTSGDETPDVAPDGELQTTDHDASTENGAVDVGYCPFCGLPVGKDFKFCPQCGKAQPVYKTPA